MRQAALKSLLKKHGSSDRFSLPTSSSTVFYDEEEDDENNMSTADLLASIGATMTGKSPNRRSKLNLQSNNNNNTNQNHSNARGEPEITVSNHMFSTCSCALL